MPVSRQRELLLCTSSTAYPINPLLHYSIIPIVIALFPSRAVAVELFGFNVHWYGLLYLLSFLLAWWLVPRLQRRNGLTLSMDEWSSLITAAVIGVIVGGRLG